MGNMKILNTNTAIYTIELHEAKVVPFKKLEQAWTRTNGDKAKQAKLIKKYDLKTLISTVRPGSIKLGVMNKLNHVNGNATAAGLDLDGELIFITNNPVKIIYPKKSSRRPEGEEIEEADDGAIVEEKVEEKKSISTLRLEKVASIAIKEDDQGLIEAFVKSETFSADSTTSEIKRAYKMFESSVKWIIYDKKTGKRLSPSKSWVKWQGAKMAAAKIGGNAEPADAAWYHDNKAKLLGEAVTPKKLDTEINTGPFDSKQKNSILSIIKMLPGKITGNSKATDVNGGGQLGVEIDGKVYIWFTMSKLGHVGSVELKPAAGKKRSTNSKDFKNIAGGSDQKALVAYVKELLSMNEATDLEEAIKVKTHRGMYSIKKGEESLKSWVEKIVIMSDAVKQKQRKTITQNIVKAIESGKIKNADLTQGLTALIGIDAPADMEASDRVVKSELKKLKLLESTDLEEAFSRLPGHVINNELYVANNELQAFVSSQQNGNDVDEKKLNRLIKNLQDIKKQIKKFNKPEDVPLSYQYKESADLEETELEEAIVNRDIRIALELLKTTPAAVKFRNQIAKKDQDTPISASDLKKAKEIFANPTDKDKANIEKKRKDKYFPRFGVRALEEAATWKSEGHYTADGEEWTGDQHEVDGQVMTGKVHTDDSVNLYHFKELSPEVRKKVAASFE